MALGTNAPSKLKRLLRTMEFNIPDGVWLVVAFIATWRITSIIQREEIFSFLRRWLGVEDINGYELYPDTFFGKLISCFWCVSVWVGLACTIILLIFPYILIPFALSGVSIWIDETTNHDGEP